MIVYARRVGLTALLTGLSLCLALLPTSATPAGSDDQPPQLSNAPVTRAVTPIQEVAPPRCRSRIPRRLNLVGGNAHRMCVAAVKAARSRFSKRAIKYAFAHLGAPYAHNGIGRNQTSPARFDCTSLIGRAYQAAGTPILYRDFGYSVPFYPMLDWTGAYLPETYAHTNLVRVKRRMLRPGDVIIEFNGPDPSKSEGAKGHGKLYLGNGNVIQSTPYGPSAVSIWKLRNSFENAWYFRIRAAKRKTVPVLVSGIAAAYYSTSAVLGREDRPNQNSALQVALLASGLATPELQTEGVTGVYTDATATSVAAIQTYLQFPLTRRDGIIERFVAQSLGLTWLVG